VAGRPNREPVIGRVRELEVAAALMERAAGGAPQVLVLHGEMGIGKTHLARAIAERASRAGALTLWGSGQEDLPLPYVPISMALAGLGPTTGASPDLTTTSMPSDPSQLWATVCDAVLEAATRHLVVLVIDDLHWVDAASQALLLHLQLVLDHAATSRPVRILTIVTVRTPNTDERSASTLARLDREPSALTLELGGLGRPEVRELLTAVAPAPPSGILVQRMLESSGGSPLLVQSLLRRGLEEGRLEVVSGALSVAPGDPLSVSQDELDRSVVQQLARVSAPCRDLLTAAAFLGDQHSIRELAELTDIEVGAAETSIDEAITAALVLDFGERFAFSHPQVRHVLFHAPTRRERQRLHLRLADRIEARGREGDALEIAHHLARAGQLVDPARLATWSERAARQALTLGAWADAAIAGEQALHALGPEAPWDVRTDLHHLVTNAASHDFDLRLVTEHGKAAIDLAREHGDANRWGEVLVHLARTLVTTASARSGADAVPLIQEFLRAHPTADPAIRAQLLALLSEVWGADNQTDAALDAANEARSLLGDDAEPQVAGYVHVAEGMARWAQLDLSGAADAYGRAIDAIDDDRTIRSIAYAAVRRTLVQHLAGELVESRARSTELLTTLAGRQLWGEHALAAAAATTTSVAQGELEAVEGLAAICDRSVRRSAYLWPLVVAQPALTLARALRGDGLGAREAASDAGAGPGTTARYHLAVAAVLGDTERVAHEVADHPWRRPPPVLTLQTLPGAVLHAEVAAALGDADMAAAVLPGLDDAHGRGVRVSIGWAVLLSRLLADCHLTVGNIAEAAAWLEIAEREADELGTGIEVGRVALTGARLAGADATSDSDQQRERAIVASRSLDTRGALPLAATARRIGRVDPAITGPARRVILFTDLVGSTEVNERAGDDFFLDLIREHDAVVRTCLREHDGVEFKHTGDGIAAWFTAPGDAIDAALAIGRGLERATALHPELPFQVRAGISVGEPLGNAGDLFGLSVVQAARLCSLADGGEVLVSTEVMSSVTADRHAFSTRGWQHLKGFADPIEVHAVVPRAAVRGSR
jgi:class 3 adenylate cyclase